MISPTNMDWQSDWFLRENIDVPIVIGGFPLFFSFNDPLDVLWCELLLEALGGYDPVTMF
jgi:hypothetical protein